MGMTSEVDYIMGMTSEVALWVLPLRLHYGYDL